MITVIAGGVGAARLLAGLVQVTDPARITAVVNVADDLVMHGLHISPDLDTVTYTLAGEVNPETGWGLAGETWQAMDTVERYGGPTWFRLGDRDLGTHLYRTARMREGARLSEVTAEITAAWGIGARLLPVTDDPVRTFLTVTGHGEVSFQDWFVRQRHAPPVEAVEFVGADAAHPAPGVMEAIGHADVVVIAPSNPIVSVAPVLAVPGVRDAVVARREQAVAVSPIVAGAALKGPADELLRDLGHDVSVVGVARLYRDLAATLVVDEADASLAGAVEAEGMRCLVTPTVMTGPAEAAALGRAVIAAVAEEER